MSAPPSNPGRISADTKDAIRRALANPEALARSLGLCEGREGRSWIRGAGGRSVRVRCPWHDDHKPACSITVGPDGTLRAHCFACSAGGDAFSLIAAGLGLDVRTDFASVVAEAAARAGIALPTSEPYTPRRPVERLPPPPPADTRPALDADTFHTLSEVVLSMAPLDREGKDYLSLRGLEAAARAEGWGALPKSIEGQGAIRRAIEDHPQLGTDVWLRSGLAIGPERKRAGEWIFAANRLVIPWRDAGGRIVALQRRVLVSDPPDGCPKYIFNTGRDVPAPYGAHLAREEIGHDSIVVFVEGAVDALAMRALLRVCSARVLADLGPEHASSNFVVLGLPGVQRWRTEWAEWARGRRAVLAFDDDPKAEARKNVDAACAELARRLREGGATAVDRWIPLGGKDWGDVWRAGSETPTEDLADFIQRERQDAAVATPAHVERRRRRLLAERERNALAVLPTELVLAVPELRLAAASDDPGEQSGARVRFDALAAPARATAAHPESFDHAREQLLGFADPLTPAERKAFEQEADKARADAGRPAWLERLQTTKTGLKNNLANLAVILENDPRWAGRWAYNAFTMKPELDGTEVGALETQITISLNTGEAAVDHYPAGRGFGIEPPKEGLNSVMAMLARKRPYHPVQRYLRSLEWDGCGRIAAFAERVLGIDKPTELQKTYLRKFFVSAVARAMVPLDGEDDFDLPPTMRDGLAKVDTVLVFQGPQGLRKSTMLRILFAGEDREQRGFFSDTAPDFKRNPKDGWLSCHATWCMELGEIENFLALGDSTTKPIISAVKDDFREPYAPRVEFHPRRFFFAGTTNKENFLGDATGNRRFWVIRLSSRIDFDLLVAWRSQLWAEAVEAWRAGETWWLDAEEEVARVDDNTQHEQQDPWETPISLWLRSKERGEFMSETNRIHVVTSDVLEHALKLAARERNTGTEMRAGNILRKLGYERTRYRLKDTEAKAYPEARSGRIYAYCPPASTGPKRSENLLSDATRIQTEDFDEDEFAVH